MKTWMKISLIVVAIVLVIVLVSYSQKPKITGNVVADNESSNQNNTLSELPNEGKFIPGTEYTCKDLIPESLFLKQRGGNDAPQPLHALSVFNQDIKLGWSSSVYNNEVGEKVGKFEVKGTYVKTNRVSEDGTILDDYVVYYDLFFGIKECKRVYLENTMGLECKILDSSCYWKYCEKKGC